MPRLTWLAEELRHVGLKVVEVDGWKTRGSTDFDPVGVTWHATAGSRTSSAQGEVNVILHGSTTAPAPIAQIMADRDGTLYLCAAGLCYHNKIGWDGPNKGLGNSRLLGIEMANDNRGEPWPEVQLDAVRRATAVIMRKLDADPMRRLAAHYEHQPYATRPSGEGSTKSDPYGVDMNAERPRVAAIMRGEDDMTKTEFFAWMTEWSKSADGRADKVAQAVAVLTHDPGKDAAGKIKAGGVQNYADADGKNPTVAPAWALGRAQVATDLGYTNRGLLQEVLAQLKTLTGKDFTDEQAIIAGVLAGLDPALIAAAIPAELAQQVANELATRLAA